MIEVLAAMVILAMVCAAYSKNQLGSGRLIQSVRYRDTAIMLASQKMAELDFRIQTQGIELIKDEERGEFDQERFPSFTWRLVKKQIPPPDFSALMALSNSNEITIGEDESSKTQTAGSFEGPMKMVTDVWGKAVIELRLEIFWREGEREQEKDYVIWTHHISANAMNQIKAMVAGFGGGGGGASPSPTPNPSAGGTTP